MTYIPSRSDKSVLLCHRKNNTLQCVIEDIDISHCTSYNECIKSINSILPGVGTLLPQLFKYHYKKYTTTLWLLWLYKWLPLCTNIAVLYTNKNMIPELAMHEPCVCAIVLFVKREHVRHVYGRALCSALYCGSKLVDYVKSQYANSRQYDYITLHTDPHIVQFYQKHGWILTNTHIYDIMGTKYPFMYLPTSTDIICPPRHHDSDIFACLHDINYIIVAAIMGIYMLYILGM